MSASRRAYAHRPAPTQRAHTFVPAMKDTSWMLIKEPAKLPVSSDLIENYFIFLSRLMLLIHIQYLLSAFVTKSQLELAIL